MKYEESKEWVNQGKRLVKRLEKINVKQSEQFEFLKSLYSANFTARQIAANRSMGLEPDNAMQVALTASAAKVQKIPELFGPLGRDLYHLSVHFGALPGKVKSFLDAQLIEFGLCSEAQAVAGIELGKSDDAKFVDHETLDRYPDTSKNRANY